MPASAEIGAHRLRARLPTHFSPRSATTPICKIYWPSPSRTSKTPCRESNRNIFFGLLDRGEGKTRQVADRNRRDVREVKCRAGTPHQFRVFAGATVLGGGVSRPFRCDLRTESRFAFGVTLRGS